MPPTHAHRPGAAAAAGALAAGPPDQLWSTSPGPSESRPTSSAWGAAIRAWRDDLTLIRDSLSYARAILAADVAILSDAGRRSRRQPGMSSTSSPAGCAVEPERRTNGLPRTSRISRPRPGHRRGSLRPHGSTPGRPPGMARVDRSSAAATAVALAQVEEQLAILTERHAAVEARLQQIRPVILRRYRKEADARPRPARLSTPAPGQQRLSGARSASGGKLTGRQISAPGSSRAARSRRSHARLRHPIRHGHRRDRGTRPPGRHRRSATAGSSPSGRSTRTGPPSSTPAGSP